MPNYLKLAKTLLEEDTAVLYGIFGIIQNSGYFPPRDFLNEFFAGGCDPCDQDGYMQSWRPFCLSREDYEALKTWWIDQHPNTVEDALGVEDWDEWVQKILE